MQRRARAGHEKFQSARGQRTAGYSEYIKPPKGAKRRTRPIYMRPAIMRNIVLFERGMIDGGLAESQVAVIGIIVR